MGTRTKESRRRLHSLILLIAFTAILLIVSTYAWFTTQKDVTISNLQGKVEVAESLEISLDGATWGHVVDLSTLSDLNSKAYSGNKNMYPKEMFPVSTIGDTFTGTDGIDYLDMRRATYSDGLITQIDRTNEAGATITNAQVDPEGVTTAPSYFAFDIFLRNLSKEVGVAETGDEADGLILNASNEVVADILQLNSNSYVWTVPSGNSHSGLQNTIRVGFARYGVGSEADITPTTPIIDATANAAGVLAGPKNITAVSIWEPNANMHVQDIVESVFPKINVPSSGYLGTQTPPADASFPFYKDSMTPSTNISFFTYGVKQLASASTTASVDAYDWKDETTYFDVQNTVQTTTVQKDTIDTTEYDVTGYIDGGVTFLKDTDGDYFTISADSITKLRVYIWMEGQDPDCTNLSSKGGGIQVQIGLTKTTTLESTTKRDAEVKAGTTPGATP